MQPAATLRADENKLLLKKPEEKLINELLTVHVRDTIRSMLEVAMREKFQLKMVKFCSEVYRQLHPRPHVNTTKKRKFPANEVNAKTTQTKRVKRENEEKEDEDEEDEEDEEGEDLNDTKDEDNEELLGQLNDDNYKADPNAEDDDVNWIVDGEVEDGTDDDNEEDDESDTKEQKQEKPSTVINIQKGKAKSKVNAKSKQSTIIEPKPISTSLEEEESTSKEEDELFAQISKEE